MTKPLKILIAPLDWGLGHTSRCLPIIQYLLALKHEVLVAVDGVPAQLIQDNFPKIKILPINGYNIRYSSKKSTFALTILGQTKKITDAIKYEHEWLDGQISEYQFDIVISDNRYGLHSSKVYCVFITHQLQIQTGNVLTDKILQKINYKYINRFDECWVVDEADAEKSLAGKLAHPRYFPKTKYTYIGHLSQLSLIENNAAKLQYALPSQYILALLSGPEPMRSVLEKMLLAQMQKLTQYHFVLIAGKPLANDSADMNSPNIVYINYLNAKGVYYCMQHAEAIICRSGYSTIMDLALAQKKALLIPTPGQTEQEYLAEFLSKKDQFVIQHQSSLNLSKGIKDLEKLQINNSSQRFTSTQMYKAIDTAIEYMQANDI